MTRINLFLKHLAQTSRSPQLIEVEKASGVYLYDIYGKKYFDLDSGIGVSSLGHCHPKVLEAIDRQSRKYLHTTVYGEHVQQPQVGLARLLTSRLPPLLNQVYFTNSGSEAVEGAIKTARKFTGRYEVVSFRYAYHGSTVGAESLRGDLDFKRSFQPMVPGSRILEFDRFDEITQISNRTAAVIVEPVRGEAGVRLPHEDYLLAIRKRCSETGALLIFDEIQTNSGRTGRLFAFEHSRVVPDILLLAKSFGGGLPLGAFVSDRKILKCLSENPELGHLTTFGGNPLSCAAALATLQVLLEEDIIETVEKKSQLFRDHLQHDLIAEIRSSGLMMAVELNLSNVFGAVESMIQHGILTSWFLFDSRSFRIAPPLIITEDEIEIVCVKIREVLNGIS